MTSKEIRRIKKTLDTLEAGFVKRTQQLFDSIIPEMQPYVEDALRTGNVDSFELPGRKRYLVLFKRYLQELYAQGMTLADLELEAKRAQFDDQHPSPAPIIPTGAMDWIDGWTTRFGDDYYGNATQDVVRVLKQGLGEGWSTEHTMDELSNYLKGPGYNKRRLEVIARTNATSAFNQGRLETFRQAGDFVKFVQFLAILDSRTTDICESRNGRLLRLDSPELAANTPPLHFQCRSVFSPVTTYDLKEMEKPGWKDAEGRTLAELQDWSKADSYPPAKGFGESMGIIKNNIQQREIASVERKLAHSDKNRVDYVYREVKEVDSQKSFVKNDVSLQITNFKNNEIPFIEDTLNRVPASHLKGIPYVKITNNQLTTVYENVKYVSYAVYDEDLAYIIISRKKTELIPTNGTDKEFSEKIILHEIGHNCYANFVLTDSDKDAIREAAEEDGYKLLKNKRAKLTDKEYFADAYAYWYIKPKRLEKKHVKIYNIIKKIFEASK